MRNFIPLIVSFTSAGFDLSPRAAFTGSIAWPEAFEARSPNEFAPEKNAPMHMRTMINTAMGLGVWASLSQSQTVPARLRLPHEIAQTALPRLRRRLAGSRGAQSWTPEWGCGSRPDDRPWEVQDEGGDRGRARTYDLMIKSHLLYRLSYAADLGGRDSGIRSGRMEEGACRCRRGFSSG